MEWFETVKGTVKKTANKAYEKSNQLIEITKLNFSISEAEAVADKHFKLLGMKLYEEYQSGKEVSEDIQKVCRQIDQKYQEAEELREKLAQVKNEKKCPKCKTENSQDNNYCMRCGERLED